MTRLARLAIKVIFPAAILLATDVACSAACIPFDQAQKHIGETECVTGRVVRVERGNGGVHFLDFCDDYRLCTFSVVVFPYDLKKVGDVRQLAGKVVEIHGELKEYGGRAEIVLENAKQLTGENARLSPLPKDFDVEQKGHFSAGQFRAGHKRSTHKKKGQPTIPAEIPEDVEATE